MVSPEALKLDEILRNAPKAVDMDLAHQRAAGEHAEDMSSEPERVTYEEAYAVDGLWATPQSWDGESAIMYLSSLPRRNYPYSRTSGKVNSRQFVSRILHRSFLSGVRRPLPWRRGAGCASTTRPHAEEARRAAPRGRGIMLSLELREGNRAT
jgi:hypothetical protein